MIIDLKSTTDDALVPYLSTLPQPYTFKQDHFKTTVRFVVGYSAVAIAAFTFYADRKLGWEATQSPWIIAAVASYFILNSILTYWLWAVEASEVFRGKRGSGETVCVYLFFFSLLELNGVALFMFFSLESGLMRRHRGNRYQFVRPSRNTRHFTSYKSSINPHQIPFSRRRRSRHHSQLGFLRMGPFTQILCASGLLRRLKC